MLKHDGETVVAVPHCKVFTLGYVKRRQELEGKELPDFMTSISIRPELELEFNLYMDDNLVATSKNGRIDFVYNSPQLTMHGDVWLNVGSDENSQKLKTNFIKSCKRLNLCPGMITYPGKFTVELFHKDEICDAFNCQIQFVVEYRNFHLFKNSYPFGRIAGWAFSCS